MRGAAGGAGGGWRFSPLPPTPDRGRDNPPLCPAAWMWTGHLFQVARWPASVLGPEMTPYAPPGSPDSGRRIILPAPVACLAPCFVLGGPLLTWTRTKRTPARHYARWHFCPVSPHPRPPPPAERRFKLTISGGQGRPSFCPSTRTFGVSGSIPSRRRGPPRGCPGPKLGAHPSETEIEPAAQTVVKSTV